MDQEERRDRVHFNFEWSGRTSIHLGTLDKIGYVKLTLIIKYKGPTIPDLTEWGRGVGVTSGLKLP